MWPVPNKIFILKKYPIKINRRKITETKNLNSSRKNSCVKLFSVVKYHFNVG